MQSQPTNIFLQGKLYPTTDWRRVSIKVEGIAWGDQEASRRFLLYGYLAESVG